MTRCPIALHPLFVRYNPRCSCEFLYNVYTRVPRHHLSDAFFRDVFIARPSNGCVNPTIVSCHMLSLHHISRNATVSPAGTHLIFEDCNIFVMQLSILAQTPLVANRRFLLLSLRWAPAVMDHPYADPPGLDNAVDVLQRPNVIRQRSSFWTYLCPRLLTADFNFFGYTYRP